jgi:hypothetical protein
MPQERIPYSGVISEVVPRFALGWGYPFTAGDSRMAAS